MGFGFDDFKCGKGERGGNEILIIIAIILLIIFLATDSRGRIFEAE